MQSIFDTKDVGGFRSHGTLIIKGMPEALLPRCAYYINKDGEKVPVLLKDKQRFEKISHKMGARGLRPILITYLPLVDPIQTEVKQRKATLKNKHKMHISSSLPRLDYSNSLT